ncbi:MAG: hypothetical protein AAFZ07_28125 [Actinomycetota bacterium]
MSRLSDVLGGVYRDDDPTPDQHDSAALDVAPDVEDDVEAAPVWELDDDDPAPAAEAKPAEDPTDDAPVWDLQSVVDDPNSDWEPDEVFEVESEWADPPKIADDQANGAGSSWLDDLGDDAAEASTWDLDTFEDLGTDTETETVRFDADDPIETVEPEPAAEAGEVDEAEASNEIELDSGRSAQSVAAASFGLLSAEEAPESDLDITDTGPWLRTDDDILPARSKRGIAFWRR